MFTCLEKCTIIQKKYWAMVKTLLECVFFFCDMLHRASHVSDLSQALGDVGRALSGRPEIILFVLPQEAEEIKRKIKYICETCGGDYGVATQCMVSEAFIRILSFSLLLAAFREAGRSHLLTISI